MAAGKRTDEGLFGIREFGVAKVFCRCGAGDGLTMPEVDLVVARVFFVGEGGIVAGPSELSGVLRHAGSVTSRLLEKSKIGGMVLAGYREGPARVIKDEGGRALLQIDHTILGCGRLAGLSLRLGFGFGRDEEIRKHCSGGD